MKRSLRIFALVLCIATVFCALFSCSSADALVGRWEIGLEDEELGRMTVIYHFHEEGKIYLEQRQGDQIPFSIPFGTYSAKGDQLTIESEGDRSVYTFSVNENTLTLSDPAGETLVFRRV